MYNKCDICFNRRTIISENGYRAICSLSNKKATDCLLCKESYFMLDEKRKDLFDRFGYEKNKKCIKK